MSIYIFSKLTAAAAYYYWVASGTANNNDWVQLSGSFTLNVTGTLAALNVLFEGPDAGINLYLDDADVFGEIPGAPDTNATGNVNVNIRHQVLEGFGGSGAWYEDRVITSVILIRKFIIYSSVTWVLIYTGFAILMVLITAT